jgi:hypothetical protein
MFIIRSFRMVLEPDVIGCKCLIKHGESLECDERDACTQCGFLHCHHVATHENRARAKGIEDFSINTMGKGLEPDAVTVCWLLVCAPA